MPFVGELEAALGGRLELLAGDDDRRIDVKAEIARLPADGMLYVCGPLRLLDAVKSAWAAAERPVSRLRYEVFGDSGRFAEGSFRVAVPSRDIEVEVRPDQSMLDALLGAGVDMIYDCRRGECGLCAVTVLSHEDGDIDHRDVFFSADERREGRKLCACVSRLTGGAAVIDTGHRA
jgi:vanillate O-demethylase ferredoxin subunit